MTLAEKLCNNFDIIKEHLHCGWINRDELINKIEQQEQNQTSEFADEQVWTFLLACGYAIAGPNGVEKLTSLLTGINGLSSDTDKIWLEVLPSSPREKEGQTHLDLAMGTINVRSGTISGIELKQTPKSWIVFCEMKWYSDISHDVSYDPHRNQLSRVIENAVAFQNNMKTADKIYVTLVTPETFMDENNKSRFYCYKYEEYNNSPENILKDFENCKLNKTSIYPNDIKIELSKLKLTWISFESLFSSMPESVLSREIKQFEKSYNRTNQGFGI